MLHLLIPFFYSRPAVLSQNLWSLFFFFFIISSSLISLIKLIISPISLISPHLSSSSHLPTKPKPKPTPFHAVNSQLSPLCLTAVGLPEAQRHRPTPLTHSVKISRWPILKSLLWPCRHRPTTKSSSSFSPRLSPRPSPSPAHFRSVLSLHF